MKILFLDLIKGFGGAEKSTAELAHELRLRNHEIYFIVSNEDFNTLLNSNNFTTQRLQCGSLKNNIWKLPVYVKKYSSLVASFVNDNKIDCVINISERGLVFLSEIKKQCPNVKLYHYCHTNQKSTLLLRHSFKDITKLFCVSAYLKNTFPRWAQNKIEVIHNGFYLHENSYYKKNVNDSCIVLSIACILSRWKCIETALYAVYEMVSTKTNFRLDLLCNPDYNKSYTNKLLRLIDKLRINSYVSILYKSNNVFEHLKQSHFVLLTSISKCGGPETFGRTIIEGWDACCVIISTNCGGPVELIKDGENGFLFEEKNYHALSQIIERVANDDVLFQKIRAQGKKSSTNFSMRNICDSLEKILTIK